MKEKDVQTIFGKNNKVHGVFELKICKGKSLPFNSVKEHQVEALTKASRSGLYHKISDFPVFAGSKARFNSKKPFDCIFLKDTPAFVVLVWYTARKKKEFHYILIDDWIGEQEISKRKSITEERSLEISLYDKKWTGTGVEQDKSKAKKRISRKRNNTM